nr:MAG TPA: hypothetical protein [Caudoviricetes sp.]
MSSENCVNFLPVFSTDLKLYLIVVKSCLNWGSFFRTTHNCKFN